MREILPWVCAISLLIACSTNNKDRPADPPVQDTPARPQIAQSTVTIKRNGEVLAEYSSASPNAVADTEMLMIELNSPDTRYSFMGYIGSTSTGNYLLDEDHQKGKATINIYNDGNGMPASLTPLKGEFRITQMNSRSISGNFSGTRKTGDGKEYNIIGTFTNIPLRKLDNP